MSRIPTTLHGLSDELCKDWLKKSACKWASYSTRALIITSQLNPSAHLLKSNETAELKRVRLGSAHLHCRRHGRLSCLISCYMSNSAGSAVRRRHNHVSEQLCTDWQPADSLVPVGRSASITTSCTSVKVPHCQPSDWIASTVVFI